MYLLEGMDKFQHMIRRNCKKLIIILFIIYFICAVLFHLLHKHTPLQIKPSCAKEDNLRFLTQLCNNYSSGFVSGSFCESLCVNNEVDYIKCLSHKVKDLVMLVEWQGEKIILKADTDMQITEHLHYSGLHDQFKKDYRVDIDKLRYPMIHFYKLPERVVDWILSECDKGNDGIITYSESLYCWHMVDESEIMIMLQLAGNSGITHLYGTCGNLFVIEYAPSTPFDKLPLVKEYRSWTLRARMAIALIEMIESLEDTDLETLFLCDFQESNFGLIESNGRYVAKSIDNDLSLFRTELENALTFEMKNNCTKDDDCAYVKCLVPCNREKRKCSGKLLTNNLQVLCKVFFQPTNYLNYRITDFLVNPPKEFKKELTSLVHQCAHPLTPSNSIPHSLAQNLKALFRRSINE